MSELSNELEAGEEKYQGLRAKEMQMKVQRREQTHKNYIKLVKEGQQEMMLRRSKGPDHFCRPRSEAPHRRLSEQA